MGHYHADHWIDIGPLRYRFPWASRRPGPCPSSSRRAAAPSWSTSPPPSPSGRSFFEPAFDITEYESGQRLPDRADHGHPHAVGHYVPAYSMEIIGPDGERIIYAGDMGPSEMVVELARDAELLILEATLENGATDDVRRGHLDTPEAIEHVARSGVPQGLLVHYRSERRDIIRELCAASGVPVEPAVTGMVVEVERGRVRVEAPDVPAWVPPGAPQPSSIAAAAAELDVTG